MNIIVQFTNCYFYATLKIIGEYFTEEYSTIYLFSTVVCYWTLKLFLLWNDLHKQCPLKINLCHTCT